MPERVTSQNFDRIAAEWVARMDRAPLSESDAVDLQYWLNSDRRARGAFLRARAVWMRSESARALGPHFDAFAVQHEHAGGIAAQCDALDTLHPRDRQRRRLTRWSSAVAASILVVLATFATFSMPTAYATAKGEMRVVSLGEGATVTLNTDTRIKVYEREGQRHVRLIQGEVLIEEVNSRVPIIIDVGESRLQSEAATLIVRWLEDQTPQVLVRDGQVVWTTDSHSHSGRTALAPNTRSSLPAKADQMMQQVTLSLGELNRELAWREGKIALQGETLAQAAALYARYSDMSIVIADANLAQMPVTGLFAVNNPLGFSRAVATVFDAHVQQSDDRIIITRAP